MPAGKPAGQETVAALSGTIPVLSGLTPQEARKVLDGIKDPELRKAAIRQCLAGMPREKWNEWIQGSMAGENPNVHKADISGMAKRYTLMNELLGSAAAVDPVGFMAVQNSKGERNNDSESETRLLVMMQWAEHDPAAAKAFLTEQLARKKAAPGLEDSVRYMAEILIRGGDPDILRWAETLPSESAIVVTSAAISGLARKNPKAAAELLMESKEKWAAMDTSSNRRWNAGNLAEDITGSWAKTDPAAALAWAVEQTGAVREKAMSGALKDMASKNFDTALEAVRKLPAEAGAAAEGLRVIMGRAPAERLGEMALMVERQPESATRAAASANLMASWTEKNPEEASAWMARQPEGEVRDSAISAFVRWADVRDPEAALLWAGSMTDSAKRMEAVEHIIGQLHDKAPAAVQPWLDSNPQLTETERSRILEKMKQPR